MTVQDIERLRGGGVCASIELHHVVVVCSILHEVSFTASLFVLLGTACRIASLHFRSYNLMMAVGFLQRVVVQLVVTDSPGSTSILGVGDHGAVHTCSKLHVM